MLKISIVFLVSPEYVIVAEVPKLFVGEYELYDTIIRDSSYIESNTASSDLLFMLETFLSSQYSYD